ncbi:MAG: hypothetical protein E7167_00490 [Firmicutes bacterium]|nr:hypothetical protein [Bacillota bacterium]
MKAFDLTLKQFSELEELKIPKGVANTQGEIYYLPRDMDEVQLLFKRIITPDQEYFLNKLETIIHLMEQEKEHAFPQLVYPNGLVTINENIEGFSMPYVEGYNLRTILKSSTVPFEEKKKYLVQIGMLLEEMRKYRLTGEYRDFYLNDIHEGNFVVDKKTGSIKYVDLDSAVIAGLTPDRSMYLKPLNKFHGLESKYPIMQESYYGRYVKPSDDTEIYAYMTMILNLISQTNTRILSPSELMDYIYYLEDLGYPSELMEAFKKIYSLDSNVNPYESLEDLRDLSRGDYFVYLRTLK